MVERLSTTRPHIARSRPRPPELVTPIASTPTEQEGCIRELSEEEPDRPALATKTPADPAPGARPIPGSWGDIDYSLEPVDELISQLARLSGSQSPPLISGQRRQRPPRQEGGHVRTPIQGSMQALPLARSDTGDWKSHRSHTESGSMRTSQPCKRGESTEDEPEDEHGYRDVTRGHRRSQKSRGEFLDGHYEARHGRRVSSVTEKGLPRTPAPVKWEADARVVNALPPPGQPGPNLVPGGKVASHPTTRNPLAPLRWAGPNPAPHLRSQPQSHPLSRPQAEPLTLPPIGPQVTQRVPHRDPYTGPRGVNGRPIAQPPTPRAATRDHEFNHPPGRFRAAWRSIWSTMRCSSAS